MFKLQNNRQITRSMNKKFIIIVILIFVTFSANTKENSKYFEKGTKNFEKHIVRDPKDSKSYLYLSKIYKVKKLDDEYEKNLNTTLLLDPKNEEALYMLISKKLKDGDFDLAKKKFEIFKSSCKKLCEKKVELSNLIKKYKN